MYFKTLKHIYYSVKFTHLLRTACLPFSLALQRPGYNLNEMIFETVNSTLLYSLYCLLTVLPKLILLLCIHHHGSSGLTIFMSIPFSKNKKIYFFC